ncbi:FtsK/SpoIIIE family DNA translocase [Leptospira licerasiae]|uniref:Stage III sporulation protein E n=1 Tax=Leptospira licerasiae str. MMD4847 TaxID=1049971 RepID=A0ABN0H9P9_9LEPT|nr:DNA translocase FtsK [Leptospira licerasiae]EIE00204.1 stage III sporulation protein E [Leptospira licerasiae serovar Varillal str. VAR 010]EJZ42032.1 putative stage III sporulation protein E [Leptospira licerasiae str. MMD4847]
MDRKDQIIGQNIAIWEKGRAALPYLLLFTGIFLTLSLGSFTIAENGVEANLFGRLGHYLSWGFLYLFGNASFVPGIMLILTGGILLAKPAQDVTNKLLTIPLFLLAVAVSLNVFGNVSTVPFASNGGVLGQALAVALEYLLGSTGRLLIHFVVYFYGILVYLNESPVHFLGRLLAQSGRDWKEQWLSGYMNGRTKKEEEIQNYEPAFAKAKSTDWSKGLAGMMNSVGSWKETSTEVSEENVPPWFRREVSGPSLERQNPVKNPANLESYIQRAKGNSKVADLRESNVQYKNSGLLQGFFEDDRKIFQFQSASTRLVEKVYGVQERKEEVPAASSKKAWEILDLRSESSAVLSFQKEEVPLEMIESEEVEEEIVSHKFTHGSISETNIVSAEAEDFREEDDELEEWTDEEGQELEDSEEYEEEAEDDSEDLEDSEVVVESPAVIEPEVAIQNTLPSPPVLGVPTSSVEKKSEKPKQSELPFTPVSMVPVFRSKRSVYHIPLNRLKSNPTKVQDALFKVESEKVAFEIENALKVYGYEAKVVAWERGPIITRYELTPPPGVKLGRITSLTDELRMYLAVKNIRIVAPIPGKSTIGIEVPNKHREDVFLGDILRSSLAPKPKKDLNIVIGKDISGKLVSIDLNKLPHLLVAGTTGSGKSVCLNAMIASLVLNLSPEEVRFIMIDPKMVELTLFEDIPHLLMPVIKDARKATKSLSWVIQEMEARYEAVSQLKCRDFRSYNEKVEEHYHKEGYNKMPYLVVFIDELADLMMVSGKDLEDAITRISQKSRAVGIHLVMATQRPSVDVITGLIKANCPARIAFHVAQKTDSKIILDMNGAESLLGKGDMLYKSPTSADLARIQAPFISEEEIEKIVDEAKKYGAPTYVEFDLEEETESESAEEMDEELFDKAWEIVRTDRKASASYLQRRLKIGYNRAARIMELMEERGYVSPILGSKGREILRSA